MTLPVWLAVVACFGAPGAPALLDLRLPTANDHLFTGHPERFYMYVDRTFEGETSQPWQGGMYGFVRNPVRTSEGLVFTRFHEGIDIAPVKRDRAGNPLDLVNSIGPGTVVYTSPQAGRSNYGKYVVVEHPYPGGPFYSLYAHLADVTCKVGDAVQAGSVLGRLGFTGAGITRVRAHLHLELCLLLNSRFDQWHASGGGGVNHHGIYNGINLAGFDIAGLFLLHRENPSLSIPDFIRSTPVHFSITLPRNGMPDIVHRHPWLLVGDASRDSPSWEVFFSDTGLPLRFAPSSRAVSKPVVTRLRNSPIGHGLRTRGLLAGSGSSATLTRSGHQLLELVTGEAPPADRRTSQVP